MSLCNAIVTCWVWTPLCCEIWVTMFTIEVWSIEIWISWIWFVISVFIVSSSGEGMFIVCIQHSFIVFHFNNLHTERENNKIAHIKTNWQIAARIICFNWKFRKSWPELWLTVQLRRNILVMCLELVPICIIFISHICCLHTNPPAHTSALVSPWLWFLTLTRGTRLGQDNLSSVQTISNNHPHTHHNSCHREIENENWNIKSLNLAVLF